MTTLWPFNTWGIDIIEKISSKASNRHKFILVAIDFFTKWVKAESFKTLNGKKMAQIIRRNTICCFGVFYEHYKKNGILWQNFRWSLKIRHILLELIRTRIFFRPDLRWIRDPLPTRTLELDELIEYGTTTQNTYNGGLNLGIVENAIIDWGDQLIS